MTTYDNQRQLKPLKHARMCPASFFATARLIGALRANIVNYDVWHYECESEWGAAPLFHYDLFCAINHLIHNI